MIFFKKYKAPIRILIFIIFLFGKTGTSVMAQTTLEGNVTDEETGEEMISANVVVKKSGVFVTGVSTDIDGNYSIKVDPGTYDVEVSYTGYQTQKLEGVVVQAGKNTKLDVKIGVGRYELEGWGHVYWGWFIPLNKQDETTTGYIFRDERIIKQPTRNIHEISSMIAPGVSFTQ